MSQLGKYGTFFNGCGTGLACDLVVEEFCFFSSFLCALVVIELSGCCLNEIHVGSNVKLNPFFISLYKIVATLKRRQGFQVFRILCSFSVLTDIEGKNSIYKFISTYFNTKLYYCL